MTTPQKPLIIWADAELDCGHVIDLTASEGVHLLEPTPWGTTMTCPKCDPSRARNREVLKLTERKPENKS